jgi:hypothetical protein
MVYQNKQVLTPIHNWKAQAVVKIKLFFKAYTFWAAPAASGDNLEGWIEAAEMIHPCARVTA